MPAKQYQHLINHISLVVDKSASMSGQPVVEVFDKNLEYLKQRSVELDQETRISIYLFNDKVECLTFDMDVMRFKSLQGYWQAGGNTALIDAVIQSTADNQKLPELYGDHAFLQYVITDGQENRSKNTATSLNEVISGLPDNWTMACLVPDDRGVKEAQRFGFYGGSIAVWDTAAKGAFEKVGTQFSKAADAYFNMRSTGVRGTKGLFTLDSTGLQKSALQEIPNRYFDIYPVHQDSPIKEYVEAFSGEKYRLGSTYYQPVKPVKIQDYKGILVQDVKNGRVYEGNNIRQLLGIPPQTVEVNPGQHKDWRVFVQSTSANRKLFKDTFILVMR